MELRVGRYYMDKGGLVRGPILYEEGYHYEESGGMFNITGESYRGHDDDLVREVPNPSLDLTNPHGTVFGLMPEEWQEAIRREEVVELYSVSGWSWAKYPSFTYDTAYRIPPNRKVSGIVQYINGKPDFDTWEAKDL